MFIVFYSCVWSSRVLDFFFLLHLWNEELVRMIVGECKSSRQRNICHRGITALWSHSQLEESVLDGRICKGVWSFQWRCWLQGYTCKHSLIHPLIPDVVFAAKHRFIILIRISMHLPKMTVRVLNFRHFKFTSTLRTFQKLWLSSCKRRILWCI